MHKNTRRKGQRKFISFFPLMKLVWPSNRIRTLFFNPTQPDEQDPKPSPRARAPELAQSSSSNRIWPLKPSRRTELSVQFNPSDKILGPTLGLAVQPEIFVWVEIRVECSTNKYACSNQPVGHTTVSDSTRRTRTRTRRTRSDRRDAPGSTRRAKGIRLTVLKPRVGRPSLGSTQSDGHSIWNLNAIAISLTSKTIIEWQYEELDWTKRKLWKDIIVCDQFNVSKSNKYIRMSSRCYGQQTPLFLKILDFFKAMRKPLSSLSSI
jgi:hypothetical protein